MYIRISTLAVPHTVGAVCVHAHAGVRNCGANAQNAQNFQIRTRVSALFCHVMLCSAYSCLLVQFAKCGGVAQLLPLLSHARREVQRSACDTLALCARDNEVATAAIQLG